MVLDMYRRPEVVAFLGASPTADRDLDDAAARIARWQARCSGEFGVWAVEVTGDDPTPIGTALLLPLPRSDGEPSDAVEIGWHVHPRAWGHGYATEMGAALIEHGGRAGHARLHAVTYPDNVRSRAVCGRLGMTELGPTAQWYGVDLLDHVVDT